MKLFNFNFCSSLFEGSFDLLSLCLRYFLLDNCIRSFVYKILSFFQSKTCNLFNSFYNTKLSLAS